MATIEKIIALRAKELQAEVETLLADRDDPMLVQYVALGVIYKKIQNQAGNMFDLSNFKGDGNIQTD